MSLDAALLQKFRIVFLKLRTLTNQQRFFVFNIIDQNEAIHVNRIVELSKMDQPIVSQTIAVLRKAQFVTNTQNKKFVHYHTNKNEIIKMIKMTLEYYNIIWDEHSETKTAAELLTQYYNYINDFHNVLKIILKENRLKIIELLITKKRLSVNETAEIMNQKQPITSQNLQILKSIEIINNLKEGRQVVYSLNVEKWEMLKNSIERYF